MANDTPKLTDQKVQQRAHELLKDHLPLDAEGYKVTTDMLVDILLAVAVNRSTIEAVCGDLAGAPDPDTIREYYNQQLRVEDLADLAERLNAALAKEVPERVRRWPIRVAIDLHDRPYYGKTDQDNGKWRRGQTKAGTRRFYRVATAYVMVNHLRVTLALHFVLPGEDLVTVVDDLLKHVEIQAIRIQVLFLDRGFEGMAVMKYLTERHQPALIACTVRGKTGGTRTLCHGRCSYTTAYTFHHDRKDTAGFTARLAVCRVYTTARRSGRLKRKAGWMLFILIHLNWDPHYASQQYRLRFGIESRYRCAGQVRGWTTSKNPAYRFVLIALSFILLNIWLHLRWLFTQVPHRGRRRLKTTLFELGRLVKFIRRVLERHFGYRDAIMAPAAPRL